MKTVDFGYERVTPAEKTARVRGVFDSVADNYDLMNDLMSAACIACGSASHWRRPGFDPGSARSTSPPAPAISAPASRARWAGTALPY